jgi:hypothetical protein
LALAGELKDVKNDKENVELEQMDALARTLVVENRIRGLIVGGGPSGILQSNLETIECEA